MKYLHIQNHSTQQVYDTPNPWEFENQSPGFQNKDKFREWCRNPNTKHYFYSGFEGENAALRISADNISFSIHGIVADFDSEINADAARDSITRNSPPEFLPNWISSTPSGHARLVWELSEPVFCYNKQSLKELLTRTKKEFKLAKLLPGFDEEAFMDDARYYEVGTNWTHLSEFPIDSQVLKLWQYQAGFKTNWKSEGTEIPIEVVRTELERVFPGRWKGVFEAGARGPRFWDSAADNHTAAVVRSAGMQCFTGDKPFMPWGAIFGPVFVRNFQAGRIANATENIWYDNKHYWSKGGSERWAFQAKEDLALHLRVSCGLSRDPGKLPYSEVDQAIYHIQKHNSIAAAVPFVLQRPGIHRLPDGDYLNTSNINVCSAPEGQPSWGEGFPWIAGFFDGFFTTPEQLDFFFAWLQRFYKTGCGHQLERGQAIFIAGPVNQGKTFLSTKIIGTMMGGAADVTSYMLGETLWNSSLFDRAVWNVDDTGPGKDPRTHTIYSNNIKKHVANQEFDYQKKFKDAGRVIWMGRLIITLNDDEESLGMLPEADISILDKICMFRAANRQYDFSGDCEGRLKAELPFFCRWLLNWTPPPETQGTWRFGVKEYHEPSLIQAAKERGRAHEFKEILEALMNEYFEAYDKETQWKGTATELYRMLAATDTTKELIRRMSPSVVGRGLAKLTSRESDMIQHKTKNGQKIWEISREFAPRFRK